MQKVNLQKGNTKLGKVVNVSLPPGVTCRPDAKCFKDGCYALKFYKLRNACKNAWDQNLALATHNRDGYFDYIRATVVLGQPDLFRWHVSGDIPDADYLTRMVAVAKACPKTRFLCFTKQYELVMAQPWASHSMHATGNLSVVVSAWPGIPIPAELALWPTAWVRDPKNPDPRIPENAIPCDGGCDKCGLCWALKPGESVVFARH